MSAEAFGINMLNDPQLTRFYECQSFLKGNKKSVVISNGYTSIKEEYVALNLILKKYYRFESTEDGLIAYNKRT